MKFSLVSLLASVSADSDGVGSGWVLSQTQAKAQTGASHQLDVREQLRGGERQKGLTDRWTGGWTGWVGKKSRGGGMWGHFVFLNCLNSQLNVSVLDRVESHNLNLLAINPSGIYLSLDRLIDLKTDELTGLDPNDRRWVGIGEEIHLQLDSSVEWVVLGEPSRCICGLEFLFNFAAGVIRDPNKGAWLWKDGWRWSQVSANSCGPIDLTSGLAACLGTV